MTDWRVPNTDTRAVEPAAPVAVRAAEGEYRPGPYYIDGGWLSASAGKFLNWWQMGFSTQPAGGNAMVEACIGAYSQTVAMCPGAHKVSTGDGGYQVETKSALARWLKHPNDYESISDFLLNHTRKLYSKGEAYGLGIRDGRGEIKEVHRMREGQPIIAADGSLFYRLWGNEIAEQRYDLSYPIPARDVLHTRLHTPRHPLRGESPVLATVLELQLSGAALSQQVAFYLNQARPSFIIETDQQLNAEQVKELRERWEAQSRGESAGGTPFLSHGYKARPMTVSAKDGMLADMMKLSDERIALAFRMPLQVLGLGESSLGSTEQMMQMWIATGLGFALNHIEESIGNLFALKGQPEEFLELDTEALLRSAFKDKIEGLARGVIGGIYAPDEARARVGLPKVSGGHGAMPRVQQQVVPLSYGTDMKPPVKTAPRPAAPPSEQPLTDEQKAEQARAVLDAAFANIELPLILPTPAPAPDERATPRTLYVRRDLLNGGDLVKWAKAQGFKSTLEPSDMHVTITFSRRPVDWMKMGESWSGDNKGELVVKPGGARMVEKLGASAVVLLFACSELSWRHEDMVHNGASFDFDQYQPHVTISYAGAPADLTKVEPYRGELRFGPEIFEELDEDWKAGVSEVTT